MISRAERLSVAKSIASALFDTEASIEQSIKSNNLLLTNLGIARGHAGTTIFHGQHVLEALNDLNCALVAARRKVGTLHESLAGAQREFGLEGIAFGPIGKPTQRAVTQLEEKLRLAK